MIDAAGHVVAPGFIDMHSHSDLFYFACPSAESKVRQGVTTEVVGMCSFSQAPLRADQREVVQGWAGGIGASLDLRWETFAQYLDALRAIRPSVNVAHFVGHGALRIAAIGFEARPAGADDLRAMQRLLGEAMDAGAFGFSTGLVYAPSAYSDTAELIALARAMAPRGGLLLLPHPRRVLDAARLDQRGDPHRRGERRRRAGLAREGLRPRELAEDRRRAAPARDGAGARRGRRSATSIPTTPAAPSSTT